MPAHYDGPTSCRIYAGQVVMVLVSTLVAGGTVEAWFEVEFDDGGREDLLTVPVALTSTGQNWLVSTPATKNGYVVGAYMNGNPSPIQGAIYLNGYIGITPGATGIVPIARNSIFSTYWTNTPVLGQFIPWGFLANYAFQGTVAESATAGTHVCTLTVTPGAGQAFMFQGGYVQIGNSGNAQTPNAYVTDGNGHTVLSLFNPNVVAATTANTFYPIVPTAVAPNGNAYAGAQSYNLIVSGTMQLILAVSTTTVSLTQTFGCVLRLCASTLPTATLADSVAGGTYTTNVAGLF